MDRLLRAIRRVLMARWNARLGGILRESEDYEAKDSYRAGYRRAYWDAVVDMAEEGLLQAPKLTMQEIHPLPHLGEDIQ